MNNDYDRDLIPVEGNSSLKRDSFSKAIVNSDKSSFDNYISLRDQKIKERENFASSISG
jgi:hypothetical protein